MDQIKHELKVKQAEWDAEREKYEGLLKYQCLKYDEESNKYQECVSELKNELEYSKKKEALEVRKREQ